VYSARPELSTGTALADFRAICWGLKSHRVSVLLELCISRNAEGETKSPPKHRQPPGSENNITKKPLVQGKSGNPRINHGLSFLPAMQGAHPLVTIAAGANGRPYSQDGNEGAGTEEACRPPSLAT